MCRCVEALDAVLGAPGGRALRFEAGDSPEGLLGRLRTHEPTFRRIVQFIRPAVTGGFNSLGHVQQQQQQHRLPEQQLLHQLENSVGVGVGSATERREIVRRGWSPEVDRLIDLRSNIKGLFAELQARYVRASESAAIDEGESESGE
jgi:hypothetical protein